VELDLTKAHLVFEEMLSGEYDHTLGTAFQYTKKAKSNIQSMMNTCHYRASDHDPIEHPNIQDALFQLQESTITLERLMNERLSDTSVDNIAEQAFHKQYDNLLKTSERLKHQMLSRIQQDRKFQRVINWVSFILFSLILFSILFLSISTRRREIKLLNRLKFYATQDELTELPNRRQFNQVYQNEWNHALRAKSSLAVIMCDIDCFRAYNDTLGHQAGDECLQKVARIMKDTLQRETDCVARYGGEEFVFILPSTKLDGAQKLMDKLQQSLADAKIPHPSSHTSQYVTLSIGIAGCVPQDKDKHALLKAADDAMYQAKIDGRNRTVLA